MESVTSVFSNLIGHSQPEKRMRKKVAKKKTVPRKKVRSSTKSKPKSKGLNHKVAVAICVGIVILGIAALVSMG